MAVEGQEILQQDRTRPAVAEQVMLSEQEAMAVCTEVQESGADQRCLVQDEASATVLGFDLAGEAVAFARLEGGEIVFPPGHGAARMHDLQRPSAAIQMEVDAKIGMAFEQSVEGAAQASGAKSAIEFKNELDQIRIFALALVMSVEEQTFLERSQRPDLLEIGILLLEDFDFFLIERD